MASNDVERLQEQVQEMERRERESLMERQARDRWNEKYPDLRDDR